MSEDAAEAEDILYTGAKPASVLKTPLASKAPLDLKVSWVPKPSVSKTTLDPKLVSAPETKMPLKQSSNDSEHHILQRLQEELHIKNSSILTRPFI